MLKRIWIPAAAIALGAFILSVAIFLGLAYTMEALYPNALAFGTIVFLIASGIAWFMANRSEKEFQENNPDAETH